MVGAEGGEVPETVRVAALLTEVACNILRGALVGGGWRKEKWRRHGLIEKTVHGVGAALPGTAEAAIVASIVGHPVVDIVIGRAGGGKTIVARRL